MNLKGRTLNTAFNTRFSCVILFYCWLLTHELIPSDYLIPVFFRIPRLVDFLGFDVAACFYSFHLICSEFQYSSLNNVFVMEETKWVLIQPADTTWTLFLNMCAGSQSNVAGQQHFKPKRIENPNNMKFLNYLMAQLHGWRYRPPVSQSTNSISFILCPPHPNHHHHHHPYFSWYFAIMEIHWNANWISVF